MYAYIIHCSQVDSPLFLKRTNIFTNVKNNIGMVINHCGIYNYKLMSSGEWVSKNMLVSARDLIVIHFKVLLIKSYR